MIECFIASRRSGLSTRTITNYRLYLRLASEVVVVNVSSNEIQSFLNSRRCTQGGKHAYYRALRDFYSWLYSRKSGFGLNQQNNPILDIEAPIVEKKILPSLTLEQLELLIEKAPCTRDKAIISLFADSGLRLSELANIKPSNIDWQHRLTESIQMFEQHNRSIQFEDSLKFYKAPLS